MKVLKLTKDHSRFQAQLTRAEQSWSERLLAVEQTVMISMSEGAARQAEQLVHVNAIAKTHDDTSVMFITKLEILESFHELQAHVTESDERSQDLETRVLEEISQLRHQQ